MGTMSRAEATSVNFRSRIQKPSNTRPNQGKAKENQESRGEIPDPSVKITAMLEFQRREKLNSRFAVQEAISNGGQLVDLL